MLSALMHFRVALIPYNRHAADRIGGAANRAVTSVFVSTMSSVPVHHVCPAAEPHHEVEEAGKQQE
jgi:hypothetical protein